MHRKIPVHYGQRDYFKRILICLTYTKYYEINMSHAQKYMCCKNGIKSVNILCTGLHKR